MVVVTAPGHPLSRQRPVEPAPRPLPPDPLRGGLQHARSSDQFFLEEEVPLEVAMETENVEIIKAMVGSGLGVAVIPKAAMARRPERAASASPALRAAPSGARPVGST